jgi:hypothetical protein
MTAYASNAGAAHSCYFTPALDSPFSNHEQRVATYKGASAWRSLERRSSPAT